MAGKVFIGYANSRMSKYYDIRILLAGSRSGRYIRRYLPSYSADSMLGIVEEMAWSQIKTCGMEECVSCLRMRGS